MDVMPQVIQARYELGGYQQFCGSAEAEARKYRLHIGKSGRKWLVGDVPNSAEAIYVEGGPNSRGFAGRELTFPLVGGGEVKLKGPWHTNCDALLADTGIDVRDKTLSFCVIAKRRVQETIPPSNIYSKTVLLDILYMDKEPVLGPYSRPEIQVMAKAMAVKLGHSIYLHKETHGGGGCGPVDPGDDNRFVPMPEA